MGERKVLNRYIPPDWDPSIIAKGFMKRSKDKTIEVRMMLPFSLRCNTCGEYMYKGKKFNSKSEIVKGDDYMGIRKFRFYIKCCVCSAEITFKTDPKNADYECESGASRNFEMWKEKRDTIEKDRADREEEDKLDAMKALENKTIDNKVEMDVLDALDEIKALNRKQQETSVDSILSKIQQQKQSEQVDLNANGVTDEEERMVKSMKFGVKVPSQSISVMKEKVVTSSISAPERNKNEPKMVFVKKKKRKLDDSNSGSSSCNPVHDNSHKNDIPFAESRAKEDTVAKSNALLGLQAYSDSDSN